MNLLSKIYDLAVSTDVLQNKWFIGEQIILNTVHFETWIFSGEDIILS